MLAWFKVLLASIMEVGWVIGLKYAENPLEIFVTLVLIVLSNALLINAGRFLSVGTAYAVFVGLGTVGTVIADIFMFGNAMSLSQVLFVLCILFGAIGLQLSSVQNEKEEI